MSNNIKKFIFFQNGRFPKSVRYMSGVQWLKINKSSLSQIPEELGNLMKLVSYDSLFFFTFRHLIIFLNLARVCVKQGLGLVISRYVDLVS